MINLNVLPCSNCENYRGIRWAGKEERTEFVACSLSDTGNADKLLEASGMRIRCDFQNKIYDED